MLIDELWNKISSENSDFLISLYERWEEENKYEDISQYLDAIKKQIPQAYAITKRPFGIKVKADDGDLKVDVITKNNYIVIKGKPIK